MEDYETELRTMEHNGKIIPYKISKSEQKNAPILIILHGHGYNAQPANYNNPEWNILCPIDNYGEEAMGSWFLGENGNHFWLIAIPRLIEHIREEVGFGDLYFWGSSMGGFASILHGTLCRAKAIYANVPQTLLLGSTYSDLGMSKYFLKIFQNGNPDIYNDLTNIIIPNTKTIYFLSAPRFERKKYIEEQIFRFIAKLQENDCNYYLEIRPTKGHKLTHSVAESIALFKRYAAPS